MAEPWREVGDRVFVRRHASYDLNVGLVVGDRACLVIDTRMSDREARELAGEIRRITPVPWMVVNTHAHFDHYFGNAVFACAAPGGLGRPDGPATVPIYGHRRCAEVIRRDGELHRADAIADARSRGLDELATEVSEVEILAPNLVFSASAKIDVGGRPVELHHLGRGHTDNDVVVAVPDAGVVFAGDLVEQGAPPAFGDAFPLDWPCTVAALLAMVHGPVVPGHGDVVDRRFVAKQRDELAAMATLARRAHAERRPVADACRHAPFPPEAARDALERAYAQLRDDPPLAAGPHMHQM